MTSAPCGRHSRAQQELESIDGGKGLLVHSCLLHSRFHAALAKQPCCYEAPKNYLTRDSW